MAVHIIAKPKRPYPVFGGSLPSREGGRRTIVLGSVSQDGEWQVEAEDQGAERWSDEPVLFVPFGGIDYALNRADLKEMIAGMRERHQKWRNKQPPAPDFNKLLREWCEILLDHYHGRQRFYFKETLKQ